MYKRISMLVVIGFRFLLAPGLGTSLFLHQKLEQKRRARIRILMDNSLDVICLIDEAGLPQGLEQAARTGEPRGMNEAFRTFEVQAAEVSAGLEILINGDAK